MKKSKKKRKPKEKYHDNIITKVWQHDWVVKI